MAERWLGCPGGRWVLSVLGLAKKWGRTLLVQPLASLGAKAISSRYLQPGTAPVPDVDLMPNSPVSRFGILCMTKRWGRQLPAHRPCSARVLGWLSQSQGLPGCSTSPRLSLLAKHAQSREAGEERCAQCHTATLEQKASVLGPTKRYWLLWEIPPYSVIHD